MLKWNLGVPGLITCGVSTKVQAWQIIQSMQQEASVPVYVEPLFSSIEHQIEITPQQKKKKKKTQHISQSERVASACT